MADLNSIVTVNITRQTAVASIAGFGVPGILGKFGNVSGPHIGFPRVKPYPSLAAMTSDGWLASEDVYKAAAAIFAQNPTVPFVNVLRMDTAETDFALALSTIQAENDNWYGFIYANTSAVDADHIAIDNWVKTQKKIYFVQGTAVPITSAATTTDIASVLKTSNAERSSVWYHVVANKDQWLPAAVIGTCFTDKPGANTWAFKSLNGVSADPLDFAADAAVRGKNANTFTTVAGIGITMDGKVAKGEYIDVIRGQDWLEARIKQEIFTNLVNVRKLAFDDSGITIIEGLLKGVLAEAERAGVLIPGTSEVFVPKFADVSTADKSARSLTGVTFTAKLQGAIQQVTINGTLTL